MVETFQTFQSLCFKFQKFQTWVSFIPSNKAKVMSLLILICCLLFISNARRFIEIFCHWSSRYMFWLWIIIEHYFYDLPTKTQTYYDRRDHPKFMEVILKKLKRCTRKCLIPTCDVIEKQLYEWISTILPLPQYLLLG